MAVIAAADTAGAHAGMRRHSLTRSGASQSSCSGTGGAGVWESFAMPASADGTSDSHTTAAPPPRTIATVATMTETMIRNKERQRDGERMVTP